MANDDSEPGAGLNWRAITPTDSPRTLPDVMQDPALRDLSTAKLGVGDPAEDFELPVLDVRDGRPIETGETFCLSEAAARRPVALIFGSYT